MTCTSSGGEHRSHDSSSLSFLHSPVTCSILRPNIFLNSGVPRNVFGGGGVGSTNSVEDRGQRERGLGGGSPLVRGSTVFANE
jgi:hypothetical protein